MRMEAAHMRCDKCQQNEATVRVDAEIGDQRLTLNLCGECAGAILQNGPENPSVDLPKLLGDFAQGALNAARKDNEIAPEDDRTCPSCGLARSTLRQRGRAGCEQCYVTFAEDMAEWIEDLHRGGEHRGLKPVQADDPALPWTANRDLLNIQLERAVSEEAFERAAALRDALRAIEANPKTDEQR